MAHTNFSRRVFENTDEIGTSFCYKTTKRTEGNLLVDTSHTTGKLMNVKAQQRTLLHQATEMRGSM